MESREIFKDIKGYEGLYQISSLGKVYSVRRGIVVSPIRKKTGYLNVNLYKDKNMRTFLVHRLVACNFIDNPNNLPQINHIDGDKTNNAVDNLEWVDGFQNMRHAFDNNIGGFKDKALATLLEINKKNAYNRIIFKKGNEMIEFNSTSHASEQLGVKRHVIINAIKKKRKLLGFEVFGYKIANEESL